MAMIDHGMVQKLIVAQMLVGLVDMSTKVVFLAPGDPDPEPDLAAGELPVCTVRLLAIDLNPHKTDRANASEADHAAIADLAVTLLVTAPPTVVKQTFGAINEALGWAAQSLAGITLRDTDTTHQIDFDAMPQVSTDPNTDEQKKSMTGAVIATGTVVRTSGRTVAAFIA